MTNTEVTRSIFYTYLLSKNKYKQRKKAEKQRKVCAQTIVDEEEKHVV